MQRTAPSDTRVTVIIPSDPTAAAMLPDETTSPLRPDGNADPKRCGCDPGMMADGMLSWKCMRFQSFSDCKINQCATAGELSEVIATSTLYHGRGTLHVHDSRCP